MTRFVRFGVLHREAVKNDLPTLHKLLRAGFIQKSYQHGRLFYEVTEKALPFIEQQRRVLLEQLRLCALFDQRFQLAIEDIRFLDEKTPEANAFLLLGDWQLSQPVVPAQIELAKLRFYRDCVMPRSRRKTAA